MTARIVQLADYRRVGKPARACIETPVTETDSQAVGGRFMFWSGASGKRYVHSIYTLTDCPELPAANFVLTRCDAGGRRAVLAIGRVTSTSPSLNLAEIRQRGAQLGASEVHVHLLAQNGNEMKLVEFDLRTGQFRAGASR
jgi:hypothetical protein